MPAAGSPAAGRSDACTRGAPARRPTSARLSRWPAIRSISIIDNPQHGRSGRRCDLQRRFGRLRERHGVGNGRIGGQAGGKAGGGSRGFSAHQRQGALVGETQQRFGPSDDPCVERQAQMRGLVEPAPDRSERKHHGAGFVGPVRGPAVRLPKPVAVGWPSDATAARRRDRATGARRCRPERGGPTGRGSSAHTRRRRTGMATRPGNRPVPPGLKPARLSAPPGPGTARETAPCPPSARA